ncbi:DMT family transporter [Cellulomonas denverensis]|uniref:DMT family transporter n=1 Tax=Cellulomonas denverensis TaxID=264297 RepID=UPI0035EA6D26
MTERARGLVVAGCLTGATLFWAGNYVVGAAAVRELSPVSLTALRWAIAALPLVVIAQLVERPDWRAALRTWRRQLMLAVVGMIGYALLVYSALQHTSSVNASLVNALNPALIALLAAALARSAPSRQAVAGMLLGLAGVLVVLTRGRIETLLSLHVNLGDLLMLGAITVWSIYTVIGRSNAGSVPPITATAIQAVLSAVVMAPFALASQVHWPRTGSGTMALLFIAVFPSLGAYLLWNLGLRRLPERAAGTAGVYMNLITVFTVAINAVLGYRIGAAQLVGGALVLGGVLLVHRARR